MEFSRQECWNGLPFPPSRDLPQGLSPRLLCHLLGRLIFTTEPPWKPLVWGEVKWGEVTQWCPTLCDPMDCSLPGFSVHRILQARILEWVTTSFSRGSSQPRNRTWVSHIGGRRFNLWATREAQEYWSGWPNPSPGDLPNPGIEPGSLALQAYSLPTQLWVQHLLT